MRKMHSKSQKRILLKLAVTNFWREQPKDDVYMRSLTPFAIFFTPVRPYQLGGKEFQRSFRPMVRLD
jgi:hypothetical protein